MNTAPPPDLIGGFAVLDGTGGKRWRDCVAALYDYLRRDTSDARKQRLLHYPKNGASHILRTVPFVWRMARELATLYIRPPQRTFPGDNQESIEAEYTNARVNRRMRQAHEQLVVLGNATLWVWPNTAGTAAQVMVIPPHMQFVEYDGMGHDESDAKAWWIKRPVAIDMRSQFVEYSVAKITATKARWISGPWKGRGVFNADGTNPLGQIPVVILRATDPAPHEFWAPVPEDLLDAQRAINHDLTDVGEVSRRQGFGQAVIKDPNRSDTLDIEVGFETAIHIRDASGGFEFASPGANIEGMIAQIEQYISTIVSHHGLNPAAYQRSAGITALAKQIELIDREIERERHAEEFVRAENRVYELMRLWTQHLRSGGQELWIPGNVSVEWRIQEPAVDPVQAATAAEIEARTGLLSIARRRAKREGISLAEATQLVADDLAVAMPVVTTEAAQITAVLDVVTAVGAGSMSLRGGIALLTGGLGLDAETANAILADAKPVEVTA